MPLLETRGAASAKGFGLTASTAAPVFVEDVFSTHLYTGNGSTQTITNGIDLAGKGGLVWAKRRNATTSHIWIDTIRGPLNYIESTGTAGQSSFANSLTSFTGSGYTVGSALNYNGSGVPMASWTFRKQPKFFDIVTYVGDGSVTRAIPHNLASVPGALIYKAVSSTSDWVYINNIGDWTSTPPYTYNPLFLNKTDAALAFDQSYSLGADSSVFYARSNTNVSGVTYVVYLFAHNAGGFGLTGTDNVISCGSFTTDGSGNATVNLGYEPQWLLAKPSSGGGGDWVMMDTMRSWNVSGNTDAFLYANLFDAEATGNNFGNPTATGFTVGGLTFSSTTYIYIAIRRGPMKTPTTGTSVYTAAFGNSSSTIPAFNSGFPVDMAFFRNSLTSSTISILAQTRLTNRYLQTASTAAEIDGGVNFAMDSNAGWAKVYDSSRISWMFQRAPGFFDVVCISGGSGVQTINHNLGVAPEICIFKRRNGTSTWPVQTPSLYLQLNTTAANLGTPFITNFGATSLTADAGSFSSGETWVGYLFASCPGVSKVGSYTGNGSSQTINCGFTGGARFVMIKATSTTGGWLVWDSARGIVAGNDPYLALNSTGEENVDTDYVDADSSGFIINSDWTSVNASGQTYIFLAIA